MNPGWSWDPYNGLLLSLYNWAIIPDITGKKSWKNPPAYHISNNPSKIPSWERSLISLGPKPFPQLPSRFFHMGIPCLLSFWSSWAFRCIQRWRGFSVFFLWSHGNPAVLTCLLFSDSVREIEQFSGFVVSFWFAAGSGFWIFETWPQWSNSYIVFEVFEISICSWGQNYPCVLKFWGFDLEVRSQ